MSPRGRSHSALLHLLVLDQPEVCMEHAVSTAGPPLLRGSVHHRSAAGRRCGSPLAGCSPGW